MSLSNCSLYFLFVSPLRHSNLNASSFTCHTSDYFSPSWHALFLDRPHVQFFLCCFGFLSYFMGFQSMAMLLGTCVITMGTVGLMADCSRGLCWPDAARLSQAAGRSAALCPPECAHCHSLLHTPSILYFPVRDLHPSVIPLSSVSQTEGF